MRNKQLMERIDKFALESIKTADAIGQEGTAYQALGGSVYYTEKPINADVRHKDEKYFFCYCNSNGIAISFKTHGEVEEFLNKHGF